VTAAEQHKYDILHEDIAKETGLKGEELDTETLKFWFRWKCQTDLFWLGSEIFGMKDARDPKSRRRRLDQKMHRQMAYEICAEGDKLLLYPRDHMKTTWIKYRIVQLLLINPMYRIGLWTKTLSLARKELKSIKALFMNKTLQELFPDIVPPPKAWEKNAADELILLREPDEKTGYLPQEGQIECWGIDSTVTGHHYDFHFYDDIIDNDSIKTAEQIEKVISWWRDIQGMKQITTEECMTGTRKHERDIYNTIIKEKYFNTVVVHKAIQAGRPFYSYFTLEALNSRKRQMGDYKFSLEFMNDPLPDSEKMFQAPYPLYSKLPEQEYKNYITLDVAYSIEREANYTGMAVGSVPVQTPNCIFVREAMRFKEKPDVIAEKTLQKLIQYRPRRLGIEAMAYEGLRYIIDLKVKDWEVKNGQSLNFEYFPLPQKVGKQSKADKIDNTLGAFVRSEKVFFHESLDLLFTQMDFFNRFSEKNDDDTLDAVAMLIMTVENFSAAHWIKDFGFTPIGQFTIETLRNMQPRQRHSWEAYFAS
jgi:hypothetical protein